VLPTLSSTSTPASRCARAPAGHVHPGRAPQSSHAGGPLVGPIGPEILPVNEASDRPNLLVIWIDDLRFGELANDGRPGSQGTRRSKLCRILQQFSGPSSRTRIVMIDQTPKCHPTGVCHTEHRAVPTHGQGRHRFAHRDVRDGLAAERADHGDAGRVQQQ